VISGFVKRGLRLQQMRSLIFWMIIL